MLTDWIVTACVVMSFAGGIIAGIGIGWFWAVATVGRER